MIYQAKHIISIRDHVDSVFLLHIKFPEKVDINVELAENNKLWGENPSGSQIVDEKELSGFFDRHGHFVFSRKIKVPTAIYIELEKGYEFQDLILEDSGMLKNIFVSDMGRLIYAFYMTGSSDIVIQGCKVKGTYIESLISTSPTDPRIRHILFERSKFKKTKPVYSQNDLLTADEMAEYLKMSKGTYQNKLSKGEIIDPVIIGGSKRWKYQDLVDWINELKP
ncbi:MAG: hypothetical protein CL670_00645 [Balneola sp.]|jgi:excisionase family DNA binding protein|nr:hypothetical protein [Balneola sp.]MBE77641.1 hypothetical protein [Balneola sp.]|tara:strand:- start:240 stop:908 length:669 start_codon:yes stop_codon:yes gene_type:complete